MNMNMSMIPSCPATVSDAAGNQIGPNAQQLYATPAARLLYSIFDINITANL